jgi:hypothetical protein
MEGSEGGFLPRLDGRLEGGRGAGGGGNGQRRAIDSAREVLEVGSELTCGARLSANEIKKKKGRGGCRARKLLQWAARALVGHKRTGERRPARLRAEEG